MPAFFSLFKAALPIQLTWGYSYDPSKLTQQYIDYLFPSTLLIQGPRTTFPTELDTDMSDSDVRAIFSIQLPSIDALPQSASDQLSQTIKEVRRIKYGLPSALDNWFVSALATPSGAGIQLGLVFAGECE